MFHILGFLFIIIIAICSLASALSVLSSGTYSDWADAVLPPTPVPTKKEMVITSREGIPTMIIDNRLRRHKLKKVKYVPATRNCSPKTRESMWILKKSRSRD